MPGDASSDSGRALRAVTGAGPVRVALLAGDELSEAGLREHLRVQRWTVVVGPDEEPDVVLAAVPALDAPTVDRLREVAARTDRPVAVVLDSAVERCREAELLTLVEYGVRGVLDRADATAERLLRLVGTVRDGGGDLPAPVQGQLLRDVARVQREVLAPHGLSASGLSDRELDVLRLLADGLELREIAERLGFSERTVKNVLYSMLQRLGLRNRVQAVSYALRAGLI